MKKRGSILILSGPSGAGKSSLVNELKKEIDEIYFSISTTTREKREGEKEGVNYHFVSKEEFERDIKEGYFLEWAEVHGNYYGTSLKHTLDAVEKGKLVLFDIDVQGFLQTKNKIPDLVTSVFITTPSLKELENRLKKRATDTTQAIQERLNNAKEELKFSKEYDYFIVNDDFEKAKDELLSIAKSIRVKCANFDLDSFINEWGKY